MSNAETTQTPPVSRRLLRIVSGLHAGASRELVGREMILVGSGDDCDIVLADEGVAAHHVLISVADDSFQLRALDAPLKLEGRLLPPGDPVEIDRLQRVDLGKAALAFGDEDDPAWLALSPDGGDFPTGVARGKGVPFTRRLPMIAAIAVLSLASLAIFAAVMPSGEPEVDVEAELRKLAQQYQVSGRNITYDVSGRPVLTGTVRDAAARDELRAQLASAGLEARVELDTGEDLATNVSEVLRSGGFPAQRVRYLGRGEVEVTGRFEDMGALNRYLGSRIVLDTGVRRVKTINMADSVPGAPSSAVEGEVRIVAIERGGETPYVMDIDGNRYALGEYVPGWGQLSGVGQHALVVDASGVPKRITVRPVLAEERADNAPVQEARPAQGTQGSTRSRAYATEQARAAAQRQ